MFNLVQQMGLISEAAFLIYKKIRLFLFLHVFFFLHASMVEAGFFVREATFDEGTGVIGEFLLGHVFVFVIFNDADAIEVDVSRMEGEAIDDRVGVLDGEDGDWPLRGISHLEGARMEGEDQGIREVLITGPFGRDCDRDLAIGEVLSALLDDLDPLGDVVLDDREEAAFL